MRINPPPTLSPPGSPVRWCQASHDVLGGIGAVGRGLSVGPRAAHGRHHGAIQRALGTRRAGLTLDPQQSRGSRGSRGSWDPGRTGFRRCSGEGLDDDYSEKPRFLFGRRPWNKASPEYLSLDGRGGVEMGPSSLIGEALHVVTGQSKKPRSHGAGSGCSPIHIGSHVYSPTNTSKWVLETPCPLQTGGELHFHVMCSSEKNGSLDMLHKDLNLKGVEIAPKARAWSVGCKKGRQEMQGEVV